MTTKPLPFTKSQIEDIIREFPTPFHIYYEKGIRDNAKMLKSAFSWAEGFREYFAVKATPNPHILKIIKDEGFGADCSSLPELIMAERVGITEENAIMAGPKEAVKKNCKKFVELQQGDEKTSKIAKQIQHKIGGDLDEIIRAMPTGGVKIKK